MWCQILTLRYLPKKFCSEKGRCLSEQEFLGAEISERIAAIRGASFLPVPEPVVETFLASATDATIIEVRSHDRPALLFGIGDTITKCNVDIRSAIVTTLGAEAIDTLYVTEIDGGALSQERAFEVAQRLRSALK